MLICGIMLPNSKYEVVIIKQFKNIFSVILVCCILFSFTACQKGEQVPNTTETIGYENTVPYYDDTTFVQNETVQATVTDTNQIITQAPTTQAVVTQAVITEAPTTTQPATQAPPTTAAPTAGVGEYKNNTLNVEQVVYYPNKLLSENTKYPVVVWANGTMVSYDIYIDLLKQIAEGGYIVVANAEKMAADGLAQRASIDFIISENSNPDSVLYNKIETEKIAAAGHSQGGRSAVNAAAVDQRIDCVYSLAGSNFDYEAEKLSAPAFFVTGTNDMIVASDSWVKPAYDLCKGPAVYASLNGGLHITCTTDPGKYSGYAIDWFDIWLKGDNSKKAVFNNGGTLSADSNWVDFQCKGF